MTGVLLDLDGEFAGLSLVIPLSNPVRGAQRCKGLPEDLARLEVLTFHCDTFVVVHVVLSTVLGLVCEGESGVELRSFEFEVFCVESHDERKCVKFFLSYDFHYAKWVHSIGGLCAGREDMCMRSACC